MSELIYLDNAATTMHKPQVVIDAVVAAMTSMGNAGRGAGEASLKSARTVEHCREQLAQLFGCQSSDHICFAANSTQALNTAINGLVAPGSRVVTTVLEHNSVLRPFKRLEVEQGVVVEYVGCNEWGQLDMVELAERVQPGVSAVVVTHASNVTGNVVDIAEVARIAHSVGALVIVDASQTAGVVPIDMQAMGIDVLCFTGHKALMGPQGTGGLAVADGIDIRPYNVGGTGVHSYDELQPMGWPTRLEAGTLNGHGIAGLSAALDYIEAHGGVAAMGAHEYATAKRLCEGVKDVPGVTVYGDWGAGTQLTPEGCRPGIVGLNIEGLDSGEVSSALMEAFNIQTRPGAHCAPRMHMALGTREQGIVRFSTSYFSTEAAVGAAIAAIKELVS